MSFLLSKTSKKNASMYFHRHEQAKSFLLRERQQHHRWTTCFIIVFKPRREMLFGSYCQSSGQDVVCLCKPVSCKAWPKKIELTRGGTIRDNGKRSNWEGWVREGCNANRSLSLDHNHFLLQRKNMPVTNWWPVLSVSCLWGFHLHSAL